MKSLLTFLFVVLCFSMSYAQSGRQMRPLYVLDGGTFRNSGWHFSPGFTFTVPASHEAQDQLISLENVQPDTLFIGTFDANGGFGAYLEFGKQNFYKNLIFLDYIDYGIHGKWFKGSENFTGRINATGTLEEVNAEHSFSDVYVGGYFNANKIQQLSDYTFLQFSLGLNVDYAVVRNRTEPFGDPLIWEMPDNLQFQGHAKIGFGYKAESGVLIIPSIETPILNIVPFYDGKSTLPYFSSRYRPFIVSIRFLFFSKQKVADCVGSGDPNQGHQLWGKEMRKYKRK